jgi:lipopolysaccharide heptosyltransferase II
MMRRILHTLERLVKAVLAAFLHLLPRGSAPPLAGSENLRFLIVRQHNQLGDMLCVVPMLRAIRRRYPTAEVSLLASPLNYDIMVGNRYLSETILYDKAIFLKNGFKTLPRLLAFFRALRKKKFDVAIVPSTVSISATSTLIAYFSGARTRIGAGSIDGMKNPIGFLFNLPLEPDWRDKPGRHQTERNVDFLSPLGINGEEDRSAVITLNQREIEDGKLFYQKHLNEKSSCIAFHPGAGKIPNRWAAQNFALVANILSMEFNAMVFITSGSFDGDPVNDMKSTLAVEYQIIADRPIREVSSILSHADLLISNDTGIMHVGAASGIPVLSLFGPTDPYQWAPVGPVHRFIRSKSSNIDDITVDEVLRHGREMLRFSMMMRSGDKSYLAEG